MLIRVDPFLDLAGKELMRSPCGSSPEGGWGGGGVLIQREDLPVIKNIHAIISPLDKIPPLTPIIGPPLNSIYHDVLKLSYKPVNAKRILISTAIACFEVLSYSGCKPPRI